MATKRLIEIDIDWTKALADTEAFMADLRIGIDQLVASGATAGPGTASPQRVGIIGAQLTSGIDTAVAKLNKAQLSVPPELKALASGGLLKELQGIKFPGASELAGLKAMMASFGRESQRIGVSTGKQTLLGGEGDEESPAQKQLRKASDLRALTADGEYIAATVEYARELKLHAAAIDAAKSADAEYLAATVKAVVERNFLTAVESELKAASEEYKISVLLAATAKNNLAAADNEALLGDSAYAESVVRAAVAKNNVAASDAAALAGSEEFAASSANAATQRNLQAAADAEALGANEAYLGSLARASTVKNNNAAAEQEVLAANEAYLQSVRRAALAKKALADAEEVATFGIAKGGTAGAGSGGAGRGGFLGGLTGFGGGDAAAGLGSRFASSAAFFLSGIALFAITNSIRDSIKQAEQLQVQLSIIRSQLAGAGIDGSAAFDKISDGILKVSKATATSASEVALVTRRLAGVFADQQGKPNFDKALSEGQDAFKLAKVTGLPQQEITDDLVAISQAFNISFKQIGDLSIGLGQDFGQSEADIVTFTAALAPAAQELGFTATQLAGLGAVAEEFSGQSASSLAENFRRVLPALQQQRAKIVNLFDTSGHDDVGKSLAQSFAEGNIEQVLEKIIKGYSLLNTQQKEQLVTLAGGRREAGAFYSILENGDATLRALGTDGGKYTGDLDKRFAEVQKTVSYAFEQMKVSLQAFGVALFQSGIGDALVSMAHAGSELFNAASKLLEVFGFLNDQLGGLPGQIGGAVVEFLILQKVLTALSALKLPAFLSGVGGLLKGGGAIGVGDAPVVGEAGGAVGLLAKFGPLLSVAGAFLAVNKLGDVRSEKQNQVDSGTTAIRDSITQQLAAGKTADQIRQSIRGVGSAGELSTGEKFSAFLSGANTDSPTKLAFDELEKQDKDRRGAALSAAADFYDKNAENDIAAFQKRTDKSQKEKDDYATKTRQPAQDFRKQVTDYLADPSKNRAFADTQFDSLNLAPDFLTDPAKAKGYNPVYGIMQSALKDYDKKKKAADHVAAVQKNITDVQEAAVSSAKQKFAEGTGSLTDYVAALDQEQKAYQDLADTAKSVGASDLESLKQAEAKKQEKQAAIKQAADTAAGYATKVAQLTGQDSGTRVVEIAQTRLDFLKSQPQVNPQDVINARLDLAQAEQDRFKQEVANARTAEEKLALIKKGFQFSPEARLGIAQAEVLANSTELDKAAKALGSSLQALANVVSQKMVETGNDGLEILKELLRTKEQWFKDAAAYAFKIHNYQAAFAAIGKADDIQKELDSLNAPGAFSAPAVGLIGNIGSNDQAGVQKQAAEDARTEALAAANARLDIQAAQARGNAVKLAELARERALLEGQFARTDSERLAAQAHLIEADNQMVKAQQEYRKAVRSLQIAQANNDPVVVSIYAVAQAEDDLANASDGAEYVTALAALLNAQHGAARALQDQADAFTNVEIARANLGGDPVKAAMLKLKELQDRLANAVALGLNPTEVANLQAQILDATANLANAQISHGEQLIQNQLTLGKINKGQAIAQLQALKVFAKSQDEIDQIDIEIKNLMNQVGQDFKFNLPSVLGLPTLYESRRLGQSAGGTAGYQDNRQISVTVIASTNADPAQIASAVAGVFGPPNGIGVASRRY